VSGSQFDLGIRVYMNQRDITQWVQSVVIVHDRRVLYRRFEVTFLGWSSLEAGATWDIFGTLDPSGSPYDVDLIRNGYVPPDHEESALVRRGDVPTVTIRGYDYAYVMMRRSPRETIVMVPGTGLVWATNDAGQRYLVENQVQTALDEYRLGARRGQQVAAGREPSWARPVGRYTIWPDMWSLERACEALARYAGVCLEWYLPSPRIGPWVVSPTLSYWDALLQLVEPYAPEIYYRRDSNRLAIVDPLSVTAYRPGGTKITLPARALTNISGRPAERRRVRRVVMRAG